MKTGFCLLLTLCLGTAARANMSAMASGNAGTGTLIASDSKLHALDEHPTASLQTEDLHVRLYDSYATVDLTYHMRNDGSATKVTAGFPSLTARTHYDEEKPAPSPPAGSKIKGTPKDLEAYTISLNGKTVAWQLYAMGEASKTATKTKVEEMAGLTRDSQWLVSELPLPADSESIIHITYRCPYEISRYYISDDGNISDAIFGYKLSTGRNWHGPIHKGRVEIECVGVNTDNVRVSPGKRFKLAGKSFVWEFTDLKPGAEDDIRVVADPAHEQRRGYTLYPDRWYYDAAYTASASSELTENGKHFAASNLAEHGPLCWAEGVEGDGIGESITLALKKSVRIDGITIVNGFFDADGKEEPRDKLYKANNRVSRLVVKVDEQHSFEVEVPDKRQEVFIPFPGGEILAHEVKLTIAAVYRGKSYRDTCIAAIGLRQVLAKKPEVGHAR